MIFNALFNHLPNGFGLSFFIQKWGFKHKQILGFDLWYIWYTVVVFCSQLVTYQLGGVDLEHHTLGIPMCW